MDNDETEAEFNLAVAKSKRHSNDIELLSKLDTELNWRDTETTNPWYSGELELESLLESLDPLIDFLSDGSIEEAEFIHYHQFLADYVRERDSAQIDWSIIHPEIEKVSVWNFNIGDYAEAVRKAFVEIEDKIRKIYKAKSGQDLSGNRLMTRVFSPNNPVIKLADLSDQEGKDIQNGYMQIFAGSMIGIRNPKSHRNFSIEKTKAIHMLYLASLLMHKIDNASAE